MKKYKCATLVSLIMLVLWSCEKDPGPGGRATIRGKVYGIDIDRNGVHQDSGYVGDIRVFISYGDNPWSDNDVRTSYTGDYAFKWLQKGDYTISVLSQCDSCPMEQTGVIQKVTIKETNEVIQLPDLVAFY